MHKKTNPKPSLGFIMKTDFERQPYISPICNALDMETGDDVFVCTSIMAHAEEQPLHDAATKLNG